MKKRTTKNKMKKKAISPVIASVLLIVIVFILAVIIFIWAGNFVDEGISKDGKLIERSCEKIKFTAAIEDSMIVINNQGQVPLYGIDIRQVGAGSLKSRGYFDTTLGVGQSDNSVSLPSEIDAGDEVRIYPVILGEQSGSKVKYTCEGQYEIVTAP